MATLKRGAVPDEELDRTTLRKRVVSRAHHGTEDHALAMRKSKEDAKKRAQKALAAREHPRETQKSQASKIPKKKVARWQG